MGGGGEGAKGFSARPVARQYPAALLQLSHHGRHRDATHPSDAAVRLVAMARATLSEQSAFVGADAGPPISLYRDHRRMDDGRAGPPAVDYLRIDAHFRWSFAARVGRQRAVYAAGIPGHVFRI